MYSKYIKRLLDLINSLIISILLLPLFIIISILVRINLGSPVIFKQERPGYKEKIFTLYKFRTMTDACDSKGNLLDDQYRMTKFGDLLRRFSLDELPQLFNILKGDMSFIGPRPLLVEYLPLYTKKQHHRHDVRPGLTGLSQINGRNNLKWKDRFNMDLEYVSNVTFISDISIIFKTIEVVIKGRDVNQLGTVTMNKYKGSD